ncbi:MAG TPA: hypothetical protein VIF34_03940 [Methylocystis sp.]|jgi:hypothetical protein
MRASKVDNDYEDLLLPLLPAAFRPAKPDSPLVTLAPYFFQALSHGGDICEFGCAGEMLSIPFALAIQALQIKKRKEAFAFDDFGPNSETFDDLKRWAAIIPVRPISGAPAETCNLLFNKISLIWLNLPSMQEMNIVLDSVASLLDAETIIGVNRLGHPARPEIAEWAKWMVAEGKLIELSLHPENCTGFFSPAQV